MENAAPYQECSALLHGAAAVRIAARERGYLSFRACLPAAAVCEVRRDVLQDSDDWIMEVKPASDAAWAWSPMSCGDVLLFHSLTIHHAQPNATDRVRLAASYRSQPCSRPVAASSLVAHLGWLTGTSCTANWAADDLLRYYWRVLQPRESG